MNIRKLLLPILCSLTLSISAMANGPDIEDVAQICLQQHAEFIAGYRQSIQDMRRRFPIAQEHLNGLKEKARELVISLNKLQTILPQSLHKRREYLHLCLRINFLTFCSNSIHLMNQEIADAQKRNDMQRLIDEHSEYLKSFQALAGEIQKVLAVIDS